MLVRLAALAGPATIVLAFATGPAAANHLTRLVNACNSGDVMVCETLYEIAGRECVEDGNRMSCDIAAQIEAAFAGGGRAQPPSQNEALMACAAGDVEACQAVVGGGRRDGGGGSGLRADVPPRYDDGGGTAFPGDPLAGNHTYLGDTVDIINSYCDDPKIGPQLTAYNFCR